MSITLVDGDTANSTIQAFKKKFHLNLYEALRKNYPEFIYKLTFSAGLKQYNELNSFH